MPFITIGENKGREMPSAYVRKIDIPPFSPNPIIVNPSSKIFNRSLKIKLLAFFTSSYLFSTQAPKKGRIWAWFGWVYVFIRIRMALQQPICILLYLNKDTWKFKQNKKEGKVRIAIINSSDTWL